MVKCTIKWSNQKFDDVEVDSAESAVTFKTQLWTLTGVPVERQKLMAKGAWKGETLVSAHCTHLVTSHHIPPHLATSHPISPHE